MKTQFANSSFGNWKERKIRDKDIKIQNPKILKHNKINNPKTQNAKRMLLSLIWPIHACDGPHKYEDISKTTCP
jgi:hypothetical protein